MTEAVEVPPVDQARPSLLRWLSISGIVVVLDQLSKWVVASNMQLGDHLPVLPFFSWVRWHNEGAAFSMLSDSGDWKRWFFVTLAIGFTAFIVYELRQLKVNDRFMAFVYALILGGALGNMVDRLVYGYVVDFILVHYQDWYFPAFNIADIALSCGAMLWIGFVLLEAKRTKNQRDTQD